MSEQNLSEDRVLTDKRISVFTGHFGSGKTEISVNYAFLLKKLGFNVAIVDLDVVNPYFRTAYVRKQLLSAGIKVIAPINSGTNAEAITLSSEINSVFRDKQLRVIFDVGGDESGARVLSVYKDQLNLDDYDIFMVVNPKRSMTDTAEKIIKMLDAVELSLGLKVSGLIANAHLLEETSIKDVREGYSISVEVSRRTSVPIKAICGIYENLHGLDGKIEEKLWYIRRYIRGYGHGKS